MKKTRLKIVLFFIYSSLLFSFYTRTAISDYQYRQTIDSDASMPWFNTLETNQPLAFIPGGIFESYTVPSPVLKVPKSKYAELDIFGLPTLAGHFSMNFTESAVKISLTDPAALSAKAEAQMLAAFIVNPVNQDMSSVGFLWDNLAAESKLPTQSLESPVITSSVKTVAPPPEQVLPSGLLKAEHKSLLPEAESGQVGEVVIPPPLQENHNSPVCLAKEPQNIPATLVGERATNFLSELLGNIIKIVTIAAGFEFDEKPPAATESEIAVKAAAKSTNPTVNSHPPKEAGEKNTFYSPASAQHPLVSYVDCSNPIRVRYADIPLTQELSKELNSEERIYGIKVNFGKISVDSALALISEFESGEFDPVTRASYAALMTIAPSEVLKALITACGRVSPRVVKDIRSFLAYECFLEEDQKTRNQLLDKVIEKLSNSDQQTREQIPALMTTLYSALVNSVYLDNMHMPDYMDTKDAKKDVLCAKNIVNFLMDTLQNDPSPKVRVLTGEALLRDIGLLATLNTITKTLCTDPAFEFIISPSGKGTHASIAKEYSAAFNVNASVPLLFLYLGNEETSKRAIALLNAIGQPAVEHLLLSLPGSWWQARRVKGAMAVLSEIGSTAVTMPLINITNSPRVGEGVKKIIIKKATSTPDFDLSQTQLEWKKLALDTKEKPLIRALAFSKIEDPEFLENCVFNINSDGSFAGLKKIAAEAFIGILASGVPAQQDWWGRINSRESKIDYVHQILAADMTDQRHYHHGMDDNLLPTSYQNWICVQYATQVAMNSLGWDNKSWTDQESFINYGSGYDVFSAIKGGYGLPVRLVSVSKKNFVHVFNAIFVGDDLNDRSQRFDYLNWFFFEPQEDLPMDLKSISSYREIVIWPISTALFTPNEYFANCEDERILIKLPNQTR